MKKSFLIFQAYHEKIETIRYLLFKDKEREELLDTWEQELHQLTEEGHDYSSDFKKCQAYFFLHKSSELRAKGQSKQTLDMVERSLALFEELNDKQGLGFAYALLASLTGWRDDYDKFDSYLKKALALFEELGDKYQIKMYSGMRPRL